MRGDSLLRLRDLAPFFERAGRAGPSRRALLLDYDGTIAPFAAHRDLATPYPGMRSLLRSIACGASPTRVAIVSGRPLDALRRLSALDGVVELWGSHGLERLTRAGRRFSDGAPPGSSRFLEEVGDAWAAAGWESVVERKPFGIAIHRRGAEPAIYEAARRDLVERWLPPAEGVGLRLLAFDGGLELRPAGSDKGAAVRRTHRELGEDAVVAYLGDDATDEDAFRELDGPGLGVLVRDAPRETKAGAWIRAPEELFEFLRDWNAACSVGAS